MIYKRSVVRILVISNPLVRLALILRAKPSTWRGPRIGLWSLVSLCDTRSYNGIALSQCLCEEDWTAAFVTQPSGHSTWNFLNSVPKEDAGSKAVVCPLSALSLAMGTAPSDALTTICFNTFLSWLPGMPSSVE